MPKAKKITIIKVHEDVNFYRIRFESPKGVEMCAVPAWAMEVAESVSTGAKVTTCKKDNKWFVQNVLITKKFHSEAEARRLAIRIVEKIEKHPKNKSSNPIDSTPTERVKQKIKDFSKETKNKIIEASKIKDSDVRRISLISLAKKNGIEGYHHLMVDVILKDMKDSTGEKDKFEKNHRNASSRF